MHRALAVLMAALTLTGCATGASSDGFSNDPPIQQAYDSCTVTAPALAVVDQGETLIVDGMGSAGYPDLACILLELDTPTSVVAAMDSTTAMMGRQEEEADGFLYEWSYHPDNGLDLIITED